MAGNTGSIQMMDVSYVKMTGCPNPFEKWNHRLKLEEVLKARLYALANTNKNSLLDASFTENGFYMIFEGHIGKDSLDECKDFFADPTENSAFQPFKSEYKFEITHGSLPVKGNEMIYVKNYEAKLSDIQTELSTRSTKLSSIQADILASETKLSSIQAEILANETKLLAIQAEILASETKLLSTNK